MNKLREKRTDKLSNSPLDDAVFKSPVTLNNYITRNTCAPFGSVKNSQQLPAILGPGRALTGIEPQVDALPSMAASSRSRSLSITLRVAPYVAAALVLSLAGGEGFLLATWNSHSERTAVEPVQFDQSTIAETIEGSQPEPASATPSFVVNGERGSGTVENFKQLLAKQNAAKALAKRQAENDRLLQQMEAWLKAKSR